MRTILVPIEPHAFLQTVMEAALLLGRRFESYVEGMAIGLDVPEVTAVDIAIGLPSILDPGTRREMAATARQSFETFMTAQGVARHAPALSAPSYGWHESDLQGDSYLGSHARVFDLTVLGRPSSNTNHPRLATTEAALFESGRPVLVVPPGAAPGALGETIVIAWNGSTETTRAVAFATPLLAQARRVVVLSVEGWTVPGPSGELLARSLRMNGVAAEVRTVANTGGRAGETILSNAAGLGCDLLIKGAYTQSRLRQMIFGGATSHILAHTTLPVFMAH